MTRLSDLATIERALLIAAEHLRSIDPLSPVHAPPRCTDGGFVYFVQVPAVRLPTKIGITQDIGRRLKTIRSSSPFGAVLVGWLWCGDPIGTETALHRRFEAHRMRGEWFAPWAVVS